MILGGDLYNEEMASASQPVCMMVSSKTVFFVRVVWKNSKSGFFKSYRKYSDKLKASTNFLLRVKNRFVMDGVSFFPYIKGVTLCSVLWWCRKKKVSVSFERWLSSWTLDCH